MLMLMAAASPASLHRPPDHTQEPNTEPSQDTLDAARLRELYSVYDPEKIPRIPEILRKRPSLSDRESMWEVLRAKYPSFFLADEAADTSSEEQSDLEETVRSDSDDEDRARLIALYSIHAPEKVSQVDEILGKRRTPQDRNEMWKLLRTKYPAFFEHGEPSDETTQDQDMLLDRDRLIRLFTKFAPERVEDVDQILAEHPTPEDREDMWKVLAHEYQELQETAGTEDAEQSVGHERNLQDKARLEELYSVYAPEKLTHVDAILAKRRSLNDRNQMWRSLQLKYPAFFEEQEQEVDAAAEDDEETRRDRERLIALYSIYAPEKVPQVSAILAKRPTQADRWNMWSVLRDKYPDFFRTREETPKPAANNPDNEPSHDMQQDKARLEELYSVYAPEKLAHVDAILAKRPSQTDRLRMWRSLRVKYPAFFEETHDDPAHDVESDESVMEDEIFPDSHTADQEEEDDDMLQDRERLIALYSVYAPEKVPQVDAILAKRPTRADREKMWSTLATKYNILESD